MFLAIVLTTLMVFVLVRLARVVRGDRSLVTPRSHRHELDPATTRLGSWG